MKRKFILTITLAFLCSLTACTKTADSTDTEIQAESESGSAEQEEVGISQAEETHDEDQAQGEASSQEEIQSPAAEASSQEEIQSPTAESSGEELPYGEEPVEQYTLPNPSWEYYLSPEAEREKEQEAEAVKLTLLEQNRNQIIDEREWFVRNELTIPDRNDEGYSCDIRDGLLLTVSKDNVPVALLYFSEYNYADDFKPEDKVFVEQELHGAVVSDGILYVSTFHYTYAESSPHNAYITAVRLSDFEVLWKSAPLTCNSLNFEIVGDVILCGYGFTAEDDYLYQLDKATGRQIDQILLASKADYIICKDDKLFVRTYHTDYVFQMD